jgi:hypothetical protein
MRPPDSRCLETRCRRDRGSRRSRKNLTRARPPRAPCAYRSAPLRCGSPRSTRTGTDDSSARVRRPSRRTVLLQRRRRRRKHVPRLQRVVTVELPRAPAPIVRARSRRDVHDGARVAAVLGAVRMRQQLELLNRIGRRAQDESGIERVVVRCAVEQDVVRLVAHPVDVEHAGSRAASRPASWRPLPRFRLRRSRPPARSRREPFRSRRPRSRRGRSS